MLAGEQGPQRRLALALDALMAAKTGLDVRFAAEARATLPEPGVSIAVPERGGGVDADEANMVEIARALRAEMNEAGILAQKRALSKYPIVPDTPARPATSCAIPIWR